ncbi:MAG: hypothetical protein LBE31_05925 [Deltaproteobacteria bacterium]|jgi:hypothetical protein|nr:hypothetical protein [Deltaproteobacteria bacterium]
MHLTDAQVEAQLAEIGQLVNKIAMLDDIFDRNMETLGLTEEDLRKLELNDMPPDIKKIVDETRLEAKKAGERVARDLGFQASTSSKSPSSRCRAGAIRL